MDSHLHRVELQDAKNGHETYASAFPDAESQSTPRLGQQQAPDFNPIHEGCLHGKA